MGLLQSFRVGTGVPDLFIRLFPIRATPALMDHLSRRGESTILHHRKAYLAFLMTASIALPSALAALLLLPAPWNAVAVPLAMLTVIVPGYLVMVPARRCQAEQLSFLVESPVVMGALTLSMNRRPSLERALEFGSRSGNGGLQSSLSALTWRTLTGELHDVRRGLSAWTATLDKVNEGLRRALHLVMAAEEEASSQGRDRLLDRANGMVLEGMKEACDRYVGSLHFPVMVVFAFGVLAPVMLFSLIPLMSMGGGLPSGPNGLDLSTLAVLLLVAVPLATLSYIRLMIGRSPMRVDGKPGGAGWKAARAVLLGGGVAAIGAVASGELFILTLLGLIAALVSLAADGPLKPKEKRDEGAFIDGLYRLGNGMMGGQDLESAFRDSVSLGESDFKSWGSGMQHRVETGQGSLRDVIGRDEVLKERGPGLRDIFLTVMDCAEEDHRGAGKVAINLAQCQDELSRAKRRVRETMRSVVDMMTSTSVVFAPAIIGLTSGMMGLLGGNGDGLTALASVYVVELAWTVHYFTSHLDGGRALSEGLRDYGVRGGAALAVFIIASLCGQSFLFRLL